MRRHATVAVLLAGLTAGLTGPTAKTCVAQPAATIDPTAVLGAIDRGVGYLKRQQNGRGGWDELSTFPGGISALCALGLLNAGLDADDPTIARALDYLRRLEPNQTYTVAMQTMVLATAEPLRDLPTLQRNVRWLEGAQATDGDHAGGWTYRADQKGSDPSNTQFALLALYEAQRAGAKVSEETWRRSEGYWLKRQNRSGSWGYPPQARESGSMTCAGVGSLLIVELARAEGDAQVEGETVRCCQPHGSSDAIDKGLAWLGKRFSVRRNPGYNAWHYYYLYALERVGRLSARRFIGDHDWYREGVEQLVKTQDSLTGAWHAKRASKGADTLRDTAFGLLFLAKGRRPILLGKVRHGEQPDWNAHRHDASHLIDAAGKAWELPMTWQTIDLAQATPEDLLTAPILYFSGADLGDVIEHATKLRQYVDRGGFVFIESSCTEDAAAVSGVQPLADAVFPEPEYGLRRIEPGHPLWRMEQLVRAESPYVGSLWGVDYGCRTSFVFCERDLSCYWELDSPHKTLEYADAVQRRIEDARAVGLNVAAYATGRTPRGKEQQFVEPLDELAIDGLGSRGVITVAKIRHTGGCDDAPAALTNLLRAAGQSEAKLAVSTKPIPVGADSPELVRHHFAFMHGRNDFRLTAAERRSLGEYLQNGGTLLADAICASKPFARACKNEVSAALGGRRFEPVPADDPIFTTTYGGYDLRRVRVRDPQPTRDDEPLAVRVRERPPQLEGVRIDDRWAVLFSPLDLSCALESHEAIQCRGYTREDAARIGMNVLLYSVNQ
ncbi:MAG: DUF4159 domain-containing protein [Planctomycetota bacterium]